MCGIVGIVGREPVGPLLVDALKRLEYRGYDSSGVATLEDGVLTRRRAEGKLANLDKRLRAEPLGGHIGIGHTRWATHGAPTERNAHPHATKKVAIVHNGIIENFSELRQDLEKDGYVFDSDTDTEVIAQFVTRELDRGLSPKEAVRTSLKHFVGAFALAFLFNGEEDLLIAARRGSPLAIGYGDGEMYLGSDAIALAPFTDMISYLEEGDWAVVTRTSVEIFDENDKPVTREKMKSNATSFLIDKGNHRHFMEKEIHEQPEVISQTMSHYIDFGRGTAKNLEGSIDFAKIDRLAISACGTAYYAGLVANTGSSGWRGCRWISMSPPSSATAKCPWRPRMRRSSCRSPARLPTRSLRCATAKRRACRSARLSMCANPPSPANPT
jgi:glutamine---fructose-6-phosphate transaminase (isomerizing)